MEVAPIKDMAKIQAIKDYLRRRNLRDEALFVFGINTALRISDLLSLKVGSVADDSGNVLRAVVLHEQKTGKTKQFPINESAKRALATYLKTRTRFTPDEPLFPFILRFRRLLSNFSDAFVKNPNKRSSRQWGSCTSLSRQSKELCPSDFWKR